jgi:hypothetical protein
LTPWSRFASSTSSFSPGGVLLWSWLWLWLLLCSSAASSLFFWNLAFSLIPVSLLANLQHHIAVSISLRSIN